MTQWRRDVNPKWCHDWNPKWLELATKGTALIARAGICFNEPSFTPTTTSGNQWWSFRKENYRLFHQRDHTATVRQYDGPVQ